MFLCVKSKSKRASYNKQWQTFPIQTQFVSNTTCYTVFACLHRFEWRSFSVCLRSEWTADKFEWRNVLFSPARLLKWFLSLTQNVSRFLCEKPATINIRTLKTYNLLEHQQLSPWEYWIHYHELFVTKLILDYIFINVIFCY